MNFDRLKARRLLAAGDDATELIRSMRARYAEAREDEARAVGRIYVHRPELHVSLDDLACWRDDDLFSASIGRGEVAAAIEARDYAADLRQRLDAAVLASAPAIRLAARVREYLHQYGVTA